MPWAGAPRRSLLRWRRRTASWVTRSSRRGAPHSKCSHSEHGRSIAILTVTLTLTLIRRAAEAAAAHGRALRLSPRLAEAYFGTAQAWLLLTHLLTYSHTPSTYSAYRRGSNPYTYADSTVQALLDLRD